MTKENFFKIRIFFKEYTSHVQKHSDNNLDEIVKEIAKNINDIQRGEKVFSQLGVKIAKRSFKKGLTLEETLDRITFIKKELWKQFEDDGILHTFTVEESYLLNKIISTFFDILSHKISCTYLEYYRQAEKERFKLAAIIDSSDDAIVSKTLDGIITSWNKAAERIFGYKEKEAIGKNIMLIIPKERYREEQNILRQLRKGIRIEHFETTRVRKDGKRIIVSLTISPVKDESGNIIGVSKIARDITTKKKIEHTLAEREQQIALITDNMPVLISYIDKDKRYRFVNVAYEKWFKQNRNRIHGKSIIQVLGKKAYAEIHPYVTEALNGKKATFERLIPYKKGGHRFVNANYVPHIGKDGEVLGFFALIYDITQRKVVETALRVSASNLAAAQQLAKMGSWEFDLHEKKDINKNELRWSDECFRVFGFEPGEVKVTNDLFFSLVHPDDRQKIVKAVAQAIKYKKQYSIEHRIILRDGRERILHEMGKAVFDIKGKPIRMIGTAQDITEQKLASEKMEYYASLTRSLSDAVFSTDTDSKIKSWNKGAEVLYGWKEKEVIGKKALEIIPAQFVSGDKPEVWEDTLMKKGFWQGELVHTKKSGETVNIMAAASLVKDSSGKPVGYVTVNRDITDRKLLEQRKDDFVALASHELKTPVTSLRMYAQLLKKKYEKIGDESDTLFLSRMDTQITRLTELINSLLDISRVHQRKLEYKKERFAIQDLVYETVETMQSLTETHTIVIVGKVTQVIIADRDRIGQVLINFINNAIKYSPKASKIIVSASNNNKYLKVCVSDFWRWHL